MVEYFLSCSTCLATPVCQFKIIPRALSTASFDRLHTPGGLDAGDSPDGNLAVSGGDDGAVTSYSDMDMDMGDSSPNGGVANSTGAPDGDVECGDPDSTATSRTSKVISGGYSFLWFFCLFLS